MMKHTSIIVLLTNVYFNEIGTYKEYKYQYRQSIFITRLRRSLMKWPVYKSKNPNLGEEDKKQRLSRHRLKSDVIR